MTPKIGDTVYIEGCVFNTGTHYIKTYKLREIASDHLKLEHISTLTKHGEESGNGSIEKYDEPDKMLAWLARPIQERFNEHIESINDLCGRILQGK
jgi:hypothetical protein